MTSIFCILISLSFITLFLYADTTPPWELIPQVIATILMLVDITMSEVHRAKKERIQEKQIALLEEQVEHLTNAVGLMSSAMIDQQLNTDKDK